MVMKKTVVRIGGICVITAALLLSLSSSIYAQTREQVHRRDRIRDRKVVVVNRERDYREIVVERKHYFYRDGYFYDRRPEGFIKVVAPLGARITLLPHGYRIVHVRRVKYYFFGGIYYRFLPRERVFVVVKAPL